MRLVINLLLLLLILGLGYLLYNSISEPIGFKAEKDKRSTAVIDKLMLVRETQEMHKDITGSYANSFGELRDVLTNGKFTQVKAIGDKDDPNNTDFSYDTTYIPAIDVIKEQGIDLANLSKVPYSDGKEFDVKADTLTYQSTLVHVLEVGTPWKTFMGDFADPRFAKYDDNYNPEAVLKFGDLYKPNTSGNWE